MNKPETIYIVYDDECPFCRNYCQLLRIKENAGRVELVDARKDSSLMEEITERGLDIDQGMVVKMGERLYYGSDAIHVLALISTNSGFFNRINYQVFKSKKLASILYPFLRDCRNIALKLMGIKFINNLHWGNANANHKEG